MKRKDSYTFTRFFVRYLVRSLAVCLLLFVCFGVFSFVIEERAQYEAMEANLDYSLNYLNTFFDTVARNSYILSGDSAVSSVMNSALTVDPYNYVLTMRQCEQVQSQTAALGCRSVYLYQEESGIVFATGTGKLDVEEFRDGEFLQALPKYPVPAIIAREQGGSRLVTLVTRYSSGYTGRSGYLCFNLDQEYLQRQFSLQLGEGYAITLETPGLEDGALQLGDLGDRGFTANKLLNSYNLKASLSYSKAVFWENFLLEYLRNGGLLFLSIMVIVVILGLAVQTLQEVFHPLFQRLNDIYRQEGPVRSLSMEELRRGFARLIDDREAYGRQLQEARQAMAEAGLRSVLTGSAQSREFESLLPCLAATGDKEALLVACVRLDMGKNRDKDRILSKALLKSVFSEPGPHGLEPTVASMDQETLAMVLRYPLEWEDSVKESILRKAGEAKSSLPEELAKPLFVSVVFPIQEISRLHEAYQRAETNLLYRDILVGECCIFAGTSGPELSVLLPKPDLDRITFAVDIDRMELVEQYLRELMEQEIEGEEEWCRLRCKALIITGTIINHTFPAVAPSLWQKLYERAQNVMNARNHQELLKGMRGFAGTISQERLSIIAESDSGSRYVRAASRYIEENYEHRISIPEIARALPINDKYLSRLFKQKTGQTILQYISSLRLRKAIYLLRETNLSISEVGMRIGFEDARGFARLFKKEYGMTPSEYRASESAIHRENGKKPL